MKTLGRDSYYLLGLSDRRHKRMRSVPEPFEASYLDGHYTSTPPKKRRRGKPSPAAARDSSAQPAEEPQLALFACAAGHH